MLSSTQITSLTTELSNDTQSLGYATLISSHNYDGISALLNQVRVGASYQITSEPVTNASFFSAIVPAEIVSFTAIQLQFIQIIMAIGSVNLNDTNTITILKNLFGSGTTTRANLLALQKRQGSRAEVLFGTGTVITEYDVRISQGG